MNVRSSSGTIAPIMENGIRLIGTGRQKDDRPSPYHRGRHLALESSRGNGVMPTFILTSDQVSLIENMLMVRRNEYHRENAPDWMKRSREKNHPEGNYARVNSLWEKFNESMKLGYRGNYDETKEDKGWRP